MVIFPRPGDSKFPSALKRRRTAAGLSVTELAKKIGIGPSNVSKYELGRQVPKNSVYLRIVEELEQAEVELTDLTSDDFSVKAALRLLQRALEVEFGCGNATVSLNLNLNSSETQDSDQASTAPSPPPPG